MNPANNQSFLKIENGTVDVSGLNVAGLGIATEPDWDTMTSLESWVGGFPNQFKPDTGLSGNLTPWQCPATKQSAFSVNYGLVGKLYTTH